MKNSITSVEFRQTFGEVLDQVWHSKKPVFITRHGAPWVVLKAPRTVSENLLEVARAESALDVRLNLAERMNKVHYQQCPVMITRRNRPIVCICPVEPS